jgi:hypothetical protein
MRKNLKLNFIFKGNTIFIVAIILIILIGIIIYSTTNSRNSNIESFIDTAGSRSHIDGTSWNNDDERRVGKVLNECQLGMRCKTPDFSNWGIYNESCECIVEPKDKKEESVSKPKPSSNPINSAYSPSLPGILEKDKACMPNSSDFDAICKKQNINYQVLDLIKCNDTESRPVCGMNTDYEDDSITTPCLNKSDDFNTWCRFYSNKYDKIGYNVNSIGAKKVLVGAAGGCYVNGQPDNSKARGVCTYDYTDEVIKLDAPNSNVDYNVFTKCKYMKGTDFIDECSKLLKLDYSKTYADQITSYDCNPGFARAKCLNNKDKMPYNEIQYPINLTTNSRTRKCKCTDE